MQGAKDNINKYTLKKEDAVDVESRVHYTSFFPFLLIPGIPSNISAACAEVQNAKNKRQRIVLLARTFTNNDNLGGTTAPIHHPPTS